jgi:hypothetical protein
MQLLEGHAFSGKFPDDADQVNNGITTTNTASKAFEISCIPFNLLDPSFFAVAAPVHQQPHFMTACGQNFAQIAADKSGPACKEYFHSHSAPDDFIVCENFTAEIGNSQNPPGMLYTIMLVLTAQLC